MDRFQRLWGFAKRTLALGISVGLGLLALRFEGVLGPATFALGVISGALLDYVSLGQVRLTNRKEVVALLAATLAVGYFVELVSPGYWTRFLQGPAGTPYFLGLFLGEFLFYSYSKAEGKVIR
ncbi:hypothetical protein [Thermus sp. NEB1569]|uniref:hypothetical protein n=1 Tax=Thermus sp. NEB1569 TaxID=2918899 RepID=UPI001EFAD718|nr:hypothetical protein [Thermus sp. NEB1569]ULR40404.1 hypothetical protein MI302_09860 [Thermus sp. NEB1569]